MRNENQFLNQLKHILRFVLNIIILTRANGLCYTPHIFWSQLRFFRV